MDEGSTEVAFPEVDGDPGKGCTLQAELPLEKGQAHLQFSLSPFYTLCLCLVWLPFIQNAC